MLDIKQLDDQLSPEDQLQGIMGVHPAQVAARRAIVMAANGDSGSLAPSPAPASSAGSGEPAAAGDTAAPAPAAVPTFGPVARPARAINVPPASAAVAAPTPKTEAQAELARLQTTGSGVSLIKNPFLRGLARAGDIAGTVLFPRIAAEVPGTTLHHRELEAEQQGRINQADKEAQQEAQTAHAQAETDQATAETEKIRHYMESPETKGEKIMRNPVTGMIEGIQKGDGTFMSPSHPDFPKELANIIGKESPKTKPLTPEEDKLRGR